MFLNISVICIQSLKTEEFVVLMIEVTNYPQVF